MALEGGGEKKKVNPWKERISDPIVAIIGRRNRCRGMGVVGRNTILKIRGERRKRLKGDL